MRMRRRISLLMVVVLSLSLFLVACSGGQKTENKTSYASDATKPAAEQTAEKKDPVTLKYTYWGSTYEKEAMEKAVKEFEDANSNIKVDLQHIPADYEAKISAMVAGNEAPDLGYVRDFFALPWAEAGKLYDIFELIDNDPDLSREDFLDQAFIYWNKDQAYGVYTAMEAFGLFYNKQLFKNAGVEDLPTKVEDALTWDEFVELCKKLTLDQNGKTPNDPGFDPKQIKQYGVRVSFSLQQYMGMVFSNGGDYVSDDGMDFGLNKAEAADALQKIADLVVKHHVAPSPAELKALPSAAVSLMSNQSAIIWDGQWTLLDLGQGSTEFGVGVLPVLKTYATNPAQGTSAIFKSTKHPDEAYLLWKWLANPEKSLSLHAQGLWMPLMKEWYTNEELLAKWAMVKPAHPDGYIDAFVNPVLNNLRRNPSAYVKNFTQINSIVTPALESVYLGNETAQEAMDRIAPEVNKLLSGRYDR
jgi:multiple sugar transport system substrate-binding protein